MATRLCKFGGKRPRQLKLHRRRPVGWCPRSTSTSLSWPRQATRQGIASFTAAAVSVSPHARVLLLHDDARTTAGVSFLSLTHFLSSTDALGLPFGVQCSTTRHFVREGSRASASLCAFTALCHLPISAVQCSPIVRCFASRIFRFLRARARSSPPSGPCSMTDCRRLPLLRYFASLSPLAPFPPA